MPQPAFIPGLRLSQLLYEEAVRPILSEQFPRLTYSAALIGPGSDVLGFDTAQSRDHAWGPRLMLFLAREDLAQFGPAIDRALRLGLPSTIHGYPIDMAWNHHPDGQPPGGEGVNHRVTLHTLPDFMSVTLGVDATKPLSPVDWLLIPEQLLRTVTAGAVFHDARGELAAVRQQLSYYPDDLWYYLLAAQWRRIAQEEAFVGRTAQVGDDLGSRIVASRLVRDVMRLCFLYERQYAPYIKWLGTAFSQLDCAPAIEPLLLETLAATSWRERERLLLRALSLVAQWHNRAGLTDPLDADPRPFYDRPFDVIGADRFESALMARITDEAVRQLPTHLGHVDQVVDTTDLLSSPNRLAGLRALYERD